MFDRAHLALDRTGANALEMLINTIVTDHTLSPFFRLWLPDIWFSRVERKKGRERREWERDLWPFANMSVCVCTSEWVVGNSVGEIEREREGWVGIYKTTQPPLSKFQHFDTFFAVPNNKCCTWNHREAKKKKFLLVRDIMVDIIIARCVCGSLFNSLSCRTLYSELE